MEKAMRQASGTIGRLTAQPAEIYDETNQL